MMKLCLECVLFVWIVRGANSSSDTPCGQPPVCTCYTQPGIVSCINKQLTHIPQGFDIIIQLSAHVLNLQHNHITTFDLDLQSWIGLQLVDVRNNPINCTWLEHKRQWWSLVDSDCELVMKDYDFFGEKYNDSNGDFYLDLLGGEKDVNDHDKKDKSTDNKTGLIVGLIIGGILLVMLIAVALIMYTWSLRGMGQRPPTTIVRDIDASNVPAQVAFFSDEPNTVNVD